MFCTGCGKEIADTSAFCPNCGKKVGESAAITNNPKFVKVEFHRKPRWFGCAVKYAVYVDGKEIAKLKNNGYADVMLTPGQHDVIMDMWSASNKEVITVPNDCSKMYVEMGLKMGLIVNKIKILSIRIEK